MKSLLRATSPTVLGTILLSWFCLSGKADFPATVVSQGPVGYWRLNETAAPPATHPATNFGTLGASANGKYLSAVSDGRLGPIRGEPGALAGTNATSARFFNRHFDAGFGGSKVEVPYNAALNPSNAFSVEFWAKPSALVTDAFCMAASINSDSAIAVPTNASPRAGWLFYQNGSTTNSANDWQFKLGNAGGYLDHDVIRGGTVTTGAWHHIVGTFDGAKASLFVNGVQVAAGPINGFKANDARPLRIGTTCFDGLLGAIGTYAGNRGFDGWLEEVALYGTALSSADIAAHFHTAQTNGAAYAATVLANKPIGYWRLGEAGDPPAANLGTFSAGANGRYIYAAHPGQAGPQSPTYPGFESDNRASAFSGTNGYVDVPPLNLNTNTVTITAWILATAIQTNNAELVFCRSDTTTAGLKFDVSDPNGLSYNWNNDTAASNFKSSLTVPVFQWSFVGLIVRPDQATLCLQDGTQFSSIVNSAVHPDQAFEGDTLIGGDILDPTLTFNGIIDEVTIFNRALSVGEVFSQYAAAVGGLKPQIFSDLTVPAQQVYVGDTMTLTVDVGGTPPLTYQWRKNGTAIAGATAPTYSKPNASAGDAATYDVIISNAQGSVTSQAVNVTVQPLAPVQIGQNPQGRSVFTGGSVTLSVQASGGGLTYQWQKNGTNLVGATNATYTVSNGSGGDSGSYQVKVSNQLGSGVSTPAVVTIIVPSADSYENIIVSDRPEAWWRLDDPAGSTTLVDAMGRHDGAYQGGINWGTAGVIVGDTNTAVTFDGFSGYAEVPFSKDLNTTNFTIECWVNANTNANALCPVASFTQPPGRGYLFQKSNDGLWYYIFGNGADAVVYVLDGSDAIYGKWTHLAITFDGTEFIGYVNGQFDLSTAPTFVPNNVSPFRIGLDQTGSGWGDYWDGAIDEVAYYQTALTADQIAAHYSAALYGTRSKPLFTKQPASTSAVPGSFFFFAPTVNGNVPLQFQWTKNGTALAGETNSFIIFTNLAFADTGSYQLNATNAFGDATSAPANLSVLPTPAFANVTNGLVLHLKFDGNFLDSSGRTNDAQAEGSPRFVTGTIGAQALHLSTVVTTNSPTSKAVSSANYATLGTPPDLAFSSNVNFSVSYWVRFASAPGDLPFLCNSINSYSNPGYTFAPSYQLGGWSWSLGDVATATSIGIYGPDDSIDDGNWHHLAHTFDRSGSGLTYLDGDLVDSRSIVPAGDLDTGEIVTIGQDASGAYPEPAEIDLDDMGVWRRVLTPFEVTAIYNAGKLGKSFDTYGPVSLEATSDAGSVQLVWQAGTLLEAANPVGPWTAVAGAVPPFYKIAPGGARKFYRVQL